MTGKPTPTAIHKLRGTYNATRHGRDRKGEPEAHGDLSEPPAWFTPSQKASWNYVIEHAPKGVLKMVDRGTLIVWVDNEDRLRDAMIMQTAIDKDNTLKRLTKNKDGEAIESPYGKMAMKAGLLMMRAASEMGFSPASRPRIKVQADDTADMDDPWAKLMVIDGGKT